LFGVKIKIIIFECVPMKLKFNRGVRKSIAEELKKISSFGGVGLG
jgi:hypothetical protein